MRWTFDDQSNTLTFHVKVKTTGWVGFGFAKVAPAQMRNYDVVVGGYDNGGYLEVSEVSNEFGMNRHEFLNVTSLRRSLPVPFC